MDKELKEIMRSDTKGKIEPKVQSTLYEFYMSGDIEGPEEYIEWFDTIRHAKPNDIIKIYINSYGGDLLTAIQFMRVIGDCEGYVVCSVEGACLSAATMIFLNADSFEVTPHSIFMFHNYSAGVFGKGGEMIDQLQHERKWSEGLLKEVYKDFLTEVEIAAILNNKDIWMGVDDITTRMEARIAKRNEENKLKE